MRVVHVSFQLDRLRRRGPELLRAWPTLRDVPAAVVAPGFDIAVAHAGWRDELVEHDGVRFHFVCERGPGAAATRLTGRAGLRPRRLISAVATLRPDVVHVAGLGFPVQTALLARQLRPTPILLQDHGNRPHSWWRRSAQRWGFRTVAGVAFTAAEQATPFRAVGALRPDVRVFEVLESSTHFTPGSQAAAREQTGLYGDPCLLWIGHLDARKDPTTALEALSAAVARLRNPQLWMCFRESPLYDVVARRIAEDARLVGRVHLLGERPHEQVQTLLRAADILVHPSRHEGSGYSVIEALACGTPPLVSDIPALRKITAHGSVGALFPPGDAGALAEQLVAMSARIDGELRRDVRGHFERELSFSALGRQLRGVYQMLTT